MPIIRTHKRSFHKIFQSIQMRAVQQTLASSRLGQRTFGGGVNAYVGFSVPMCFALLVLGGNLRFSLGIRAVWLGILLAFSTITLFVNGVRAGLVIGAAGVLAAAMFSGGRQFAKASSGIVGCLILGSIAWSFAQNFTHGHSVVRYTTTITNPVAAIHADRQTFFDQFSDIVSHVPLGNGLGKVTPNAGQFLTGSTERPPGADIFQRGLFSFHDY